MGRPKRDRPTCIFCGPPVSPNRMSDEHLWPDWMGDLLPNKDQTTIKRQTWTWAHHTKPREVTEAQQQQRLSSKTFPVVCANCNNRWMSVLESSVRPFLEPLIKGQSVAMTTDRQRLLAQWLAMKTFVLDHERMGQGPYFPIQTQDERTAFMNNRQMPFGFRAWIGYGTGDEWAVRGARSRSLSILLPTMPPADFDGRGKPKNVHSITWGLGNLRVFISSTIAAHVYPQMAWTIPDFLPIWPAQSPDFVWPPKVAVSDDFMVRLTDALQDQMALTTVRPPGSEQT